MNTPDQCLAPNKKRLRQWFVFFWKHLISKTYFTVIILITHYFTSRFKDDVLLPLPARSSCIQNIYSKDIGSTLWCSLFIYLWFDIPPRSPPPAARAHTLHYCVASITIITYSHYDHIFILSFLIAFLLCARANEPLVRFVSRDHVV